MLAVERKWAFHLSTKISWILCLPKCYHPKLCQSLDQCRKTDHNFSFYRISNKDDITSLVFDSLVYEYQQLFPGARRESRNTYPYLYDDFNKETQEERNVQYNLVTLYIELWQKVQFFPTQNCHLYADTTRGVWGCVCVCYFINIFKKKCIVYICPAVYRRQT